MNTLRLLEVLKDATDEGLWQERAAILDELGLDCEVPVRTVRVAASRKFAINASNLALRDYVSTKAWLGAPDKMRELAAINRSIERSLADAAYSKIWVTL